MKAGPPLTSPITQTPGTLVSSLPLCLMQPPGRSRCRLCRGRGRPSWAPGRSHTRRCEPVSVSVMPSFFSMRRARCPSPSSRPWWSWRRGETHAFVFERLLQALGDFGVLARDDLVVELDDRDVAAEAAEHLAELEPEVVAAEDDQVLRHLLEVHDVAVGQVLDLVEAGNRQDARAGAGVDEDACRCVSVSPLTSTSCGPVKRAWPR